MNPRLSAAEALACPSRRRWCASALALLTGGAVCGRLPAVEELEPGVKTVLAEFLIWADQVALRERHFDHPREDQAEALKGLGRDAAGLLQVAGTKEGHLLLVDENPGSLEMRTVSPFNENRGINLRLGIFPFSGKAARWTHPPSAGGEMPPHPVALIAVATEDAEGDRETRSFHLYQYGRTGKRTVLSGARRLADFMEQEPEVSACLPVDAAASEAAREADRARRSLLVKDGREWSKDASFQALRKRLLGSKEAGTQWSAHFLPARQSLVVEPFWVNDAGADMALDWASSGGVPDPALFRHLFSLMHALKYQWDSGAGLFRAAGTAPRPSDVAWFEMETGEKA